MIFLIIFWLSIVWIYIAGVIIPKWYLKLITRKFVIPYFDNRKLSHLDIVRIPFSIPRDKGDFNDEIILNPFYDTRFNKKKYYYVFYLDSKGNKKRTTLKVCHNFYGFPKSVEVYPEVLNKSNE